MTRRLTKLAAVYLLLGLVATWGVAWGCELFVERDHRTYQKGNQAWPFNSAPEDWPTYCHSLTRHTGMGRTLLHSEHHTWKSGFSESDEVFGHIEVSVGFPVECLLWRVMFREAERAGLRVTPQQPLFIRGLSIRSDEPLVPGDFDERRLPLSPIWPGLIANTVFYAAVFLALHQFVAFTRRWRRRRRGRCAECGYDLAGIEGECPECGDPS